MHNQPVTSAAPAVAYMGTLIVHMNDIISACVGLAALFYYYLVISKMLKERKDARANKPSSEAD